MKKTYFFSYLLIAAMLLVVSCTQDENTEIIDDSTKTQVEPDFFENDGSTNLNEEGPEEEAPVTDGDVSLKTYYYYDYTLLKPSDMKQGDVNEIKCGETKTMPLLVGSSKKKVGVVKVSNDEENLYLTVKADDYMYMKKVYFNIGAKGDIPFFSNGFPNLYKFNYKAFPYYFGGQKKATYVIPLSSIDLDCFEIVAYAKVFDKRSWCFYSAFAYNQERTQQYYYSYYSRCYYFKDWVRSFEYCKEECKQACEGEDAFGHKETGNLRFCFLDDGFSEAGWTQRFTHIWLRDYFNRRGFAYRYPLIAEPQTCDTESGKEVGYIEMLPSYNGSEVFMTIDYVLTDPSYSITEVNLYMGRDIYPKDADGLDTIDVDSYTYKVEDLDTNDYTFSNIPWPTSLEEDANIFVIPHAKICKVEM